MSRHTFDVDPGLGSIIPRANFRATSFNLGNVFVGCAGAVIDILISRDSWARYDDEFRDPHSESSLDSDF